MHLTVEGGHPRAESAAGNVSLAFDVQNVASSPVPYVREFYFCTNTDCTVNLAYSSSTQADALSGTSALINSTLFTSWLKPSAPVSPTSVSQVFLGPSESPLIQEEWFLEKT